MPYATPEILGGGHITILAESTTPTVLMTTQATPVDGRTSGKVYLAIGKSVSGWQGCMHKIGFESTDSWATPLSTVGLTGSSTRTTDIPVNFYAQFGEDILRLDVVVRTTLGTQRGSNATSVYHWG
jgi:hypothetical protein